MPSNEYAITSSGPLAVRGIREAKDIDIIVNDKLWQELIKKYPVKQMSFNEAINIGDIEVMGNFTTNQLVPTETQIAEADIIDGRRYVNLDTIIKFKKLLSREKDLADLKLIEDYLAKA